MVDFYPQVKMVHVMTVVASGSLFLLRGLAVQAGGRLACFVAAIATYATMFAIARTHDPLGPLRALLA